MEHHKVIILGSGPAGIQSAYFLKKLGIDYIILERNEIPGSFFSRFPVSGNLISLNKVHTGTDDPNINLRYDWNSLLNDEGLLFKQFSEEFYPHADSLKEYLLEFSRSNNLNIRYNHNVISVDKLDDQYIVNTNMGNFTCEKLFVASGLTPLKTIHPHYGKLGREFFNDKEKFKGKTVIIIGAGNSGFELSNLLTPYASTIILFGRSLKLASNTHYAGHVRSNYLGFIDTAMLKLQNFMCISICEKNFEDINFSYDEIKNKYICNFERHAISIKEFDYLFLCTGFEFDDSIFNFHINRNGKFPSLNEIYESNNNSNLFFVGSLMHGLDFGKSPGGFIHGFRYSIKYMITEIFSSNKRIIFNSIAAVINFAFNRLTNESGLIVMFDQFCDYIEKEGENYTYVPLVNKQWVDKNSKNDYITLSFNYGVPLFDVFKDKRGKENDEKVPGFIHPIITNKRGEKFHGLEDDILNFKKFCHRRKLSYCILKGFE